MTPRKKMRAIPIPPTRACLPLLWRAENMSLSPVAAPNQSAKTPFRLTLHPTITQSTGRTHIGVGGERSIKNSYSEPRRNRTGLLTSDSSSPKRKVKDRSSYHGNENGSPVSNPHASSPQSEEPLGSAK